MATYQRQTNPNIFQPYIYQQPMDLIAQNLALRESKYDAGVEAIAKTYNNALNLEVSLDESQNFIDNKFKEIKPEIQKMSTIDFSVKDNVDKAVNVFNPITSNQNIVKDVSLTRFYKNQFNKYNKFLQSTDPDTRAMASEENLRYMSKGYNEFVSSGWDGIDKSTASKRAYTPYYNVSKELMKTFKESGYDVSVDEHSGDYIVTRKNGERLVSPLSSLAGLSLSGPARKQLAIEAENRYDRELAAGSNPVELGRRAINLERQGLTTQSLKLHNEAVKVQNKIDILNKKNVNDLTPEEKVNLQEYTKYMTDILPTIVKYDARLEDLNKLTDDQLTILGGRESYISSYTDAYIRGMAESYATGKYNFKMREDRVSLQQNSFAHANNMQTRQFNQEKQMAAVDFANKSALENQKATNELQLYGEKKKIDALYGDVTGKSTSNAGTETYSATDPRNTDLGTPDVPDTDPLTNPEDVGQLYAAKNNTKQQLTSNIANSNQAVLAGMLPISTNLNINDMGSYIISQRNATDVNVPLKNGLPTAQSQRMLQIAKELQRLGKLPLAGKKPEDLSSVQLAKNIQSVINNEIDYISSTGRSNYNLTPEQVRNVSNNSTRNEILLRDLDNIDLQQKDFVNALERSNIGPVAKAVARRNPNVLDDKDAYYNQVYNMVKTGQIKIPNVYVDKDGTIYKTAKSLRPDIDGPYRRTKITSGADLPGVNDYADVREQMNQVYRDAGTNLKVASNVGTSYGPKVASATYQEYKSLITEELNNPNSTNAPLKFLSDNNLLALLDNEGVVKKVTLYGPRDGKQKMRVYIDPVKIQEAGKKLSKDFDFRGMINLKSGVYNKNNPDPYSFSLDIPNNSYESSVQFGLGNGRNYNTENSVAQFSLRPGTTNQTAVNYGAVRKIKSSGTYMTINADGSPTFEDEFTSIPSQDIMANREAQLQLNTQKAQDLNNLYSTMHLGSNKQAVLDVIKKMPDAVKQNPDGTYSLRKDVFLSLFPNASIFLK